MIHRDLQSTYLRLLCLAFAIGLFALTGASRATGRIASADAALNRFNDTADSKLKRLVSPTAMAIINAYRKTPSPVIRKTTEMPSDTPSCNLFSAGKASGNSGGMWLLTYEIGFKGMTVYLDADSGSVLCIGLTREG